MTTLDVKAGQPADMTVSHVPAPPLTTQPVDRVQPSTELDPQADDFDAVRADGGLVHIRPVMAGDLDAVTALHAGLSDRSRYLRFFSFSPRSASTYIPRLLQPASAQHVALTAWVGDELVGIAAFERLTAESAEIALVVADNRHHDGIGTLLLEHLAAAARRWGIRRFDADVLAENGPALEVLRELGYVIEARSEGYTTRIVLDLSPDAAAEQALESREHLADVAILRPLLAPTSVVVIGAGSRPESVGHQVLRSILAGGFTGSVQVVNPHHDSVLGVPCVHSVAQLPQPVELAVVAVPADQVAEVVRACGERSISGLVLLSSGFGETGDAGRQLQVEVATIARRYGMRVVGPNCLGLVNTHPAVRLNATFAELPDLPGALGLVSQSGGLGIAVIAAAARSGLGISQFVSVGNKCDISSNDLLLAWDDDDRTRVIGLYLESFGNPRRFARIARAVAAHKPIIAIKAGRSAAGRLAGQSHTAAAAASDVVVDALFTQAGVLRVDTMEQMLDGARVLCDQPLPRGPRVVVVSNAGGPGIMAADAAASAGLTMVVLPPDVESQLRLAVPAAPSCRNPVDLGAAVRPSELGAALKVILAADEVDAVLAVFTDVAVSDPEAAMAEIAAAAGSSEKPLIATRVGALPTSIAISGSDHCLPVFTFPEPAAAAIALAVRYSGIRSTPRISIARPANVDRVTAGTIVARAIAGGSDWLGADDLAQLLDCYGIPGCPQRVVRDVDAAVTAAAELGYPVAIKITGGGLHKTDIGGVRLGVTDELELRRAFADLAVLSPGPPALLVQPMLPASTEVIIGAVQHDQFGPAVMVGAGGILADLLADRVFRLAPLTTRDAHEMLEELRTAKLFDGYRGSPVISRDRLCDLIVRVGALADDLPEVTELDLNPVICLEQELVVVDARARVRVAPPRRDPLLRQLH